ncbi:MAG: hypothetical protein WAS36_02595 [Candidatus Saccharimonadales bacterium]
MNTFTLPDPERFAVGEPNLTTSHLRETFAAFHTRYAQEALDTFGQELEHTEGHSGNFLLTPNNGVKQLDGCVSTGEFNAGGVNLLDHSLSISEDRKYSLTIGPPELTSAGKLTVSLGTYEGLTVPTQLGNSYRADVDYGIFTVEALNYVLDRTIESFQRLTA